MAIQATYTHAGITVSNAYICIDRFSGGKLRDWTAVAYVYMDESKESGIIAPINFCAPYVGENPYATLYNKLKEMYPEHTDV